MRKRCSRSGATTGASGYGSTLTLEILARAALAHVNPALLADSSRDPKDWNNLYYALGGKPRAAKFVPKSVDITSVFDRLSDIWTSFDSDRVGIAKAHITKRNEELHAGANPFDAGSGDWLGEYYDVCAALLESMGESLASLLGDKEAGVAKKLVTAAKDESAKAVNKAIHQHRRSWEAVSKRYTLRLRASIWAAQHVGHRVTCPACKSQAVVTGEPIAEPHATISGGMVTEKQDHLPSKFECIACGLKIVGLARIAAARLGNTYTSTRTYNLEEYFGDRTEFEGFEDDNNEP